MLLLLLIQCRSLEQREVSCLHLFSYTDTIRLSSISRFIALVIFTKDCFRAWHIRAPACVHDDVIQVGPGPPSLLKSPLVETKWLKLRLRWRSFFHHRQWQEEGMLSAPATLERRAWPTAPGKLLVFLALMVPMHTHIHPHVIVHTHICMYAHCW